MTATLTTPYTQLNGQADEWETYIPILNGRNLGIWFRVNKNSVTYSFALRHAIGDPERVAILYNRKYHQLAIRPARPTDAYTAKTTGNISRTSLERAFKITLRDDRYDVTISGDMAIVDLS